MPLTLYAATIPSYLQILGSVERLADDMQPFAYQVKSTAVHSIGAIEGVRRGGFSPDSSPLPTTFEALRQRVGEAIANLQAIEPDEVESFIGQEIRFTFGESHIDFLRPVDN